VFAPLRFNADGSVRELDCSPGASFQISHGGQTVSIPSGKALAATDSSPTVANVIIKMAKDRISR
jgi:hypothetical protein